LRYLAEKGYRTVPSDGVIAGTRDFRTLVGKVKSEGPDVIFLLTYAGEGAAFMKALRELGLKTAVYGSDNISSEEFTSAGAAAIEGVRVAMPSPAGGLQYDSFVERYKKRYGQSPDANISKSYDAMSLMAKAIEQNGPDPVRIRQYFASPDFSYEGVSGQIRFDSNGDLVGQQYTRMVYHASKLIPLQ
jgi:branched-chain amino acid transport system substrate-binding protein